MLGNLSTCTLQFNLTLAYYTLTITSLSVNNLLPTAGKYLR